MADIELVIKIPEEIHKKIQSGEFWLSCGLTLSNAYDYIKNGIPIPDNATNGQIIQTLFKPNRVGRTDDDVIVENYDFSKEWWNSPYQKGDKK